MQTTASKLLHISIILSNQKSVHLNSYRTLLKQSAAAMQQDHFVARKGLVTYAEVGTDRKL